MVLKHASVFSGIGGFDLAAKWMGWENVFNCEIDLYCQKILHQHFPESEQLNDIKLTDFTKYANKIDILTGGFPCQPFSLSGKRKGKNDDRYLWPEMLRAIREISPTFIICENVPGIINWNRGLVFQQVQTDLENEGYEVQSIILPACSVNAPHKRDRVWFIAYSDKKRLQHRDVIKSGEIQNIKERIQNNGQIGRSFSNELIANSDISRFKECWPKWFTSKEFTQDYGITSKPGIYRGDDGFSNRADRVKALGNAIIPQLALELFLNIDYLYDTI